MLSIYLSLTPADQAKYCTTMRVTVKANGEIASLPTGTSLIVRTMGRPSLSPPFFIQSFSLPHSHQRLRRVLSHYRRPLSHCRHPFSPRASIEPSPPTGDTEAVSLAVAASLVLSAGLPPSSLSAAALAAYARAKGAPSAAAYAADVRAARAPWDGEGTADARRRLLHRVCNGEGDATYEDPESGYTVFAAVAHLRRGGCCGVGDEGRTHRCRHCPYAEDGSLTARVFVEMKNRIPLLDRVREETARLYGAGRERAAEEVRVVQKEAVGEVGEESTEEVCETCQGEGEVTCLRCNGFAFLFSPQTMVCPQCAGTSVHPCMDCSPWTPPQRTKFGT